MAIGRLTQITLRAGAQPGSPPREVELSPVTIFVGPNGGGKSSALADLFQYSTRGNSQPGGAPWGGGTVIADATVPGPTTKEEALEFLAPRTHEVNEHQVVIRAFDTRAAGPGTGSGVHGI